MRNSRNMNKKLAQAASSIQPTDEQMEQLEKLSDKYKGKDQKEIQREMEQLARSFSQKEKADMIQRLKMLKQMSGLLNSEQQRKVDYFIDLLTR
ncbi:MAG: hypothetical protein ACOYVK_17895 [Bacillota bacterium]